MDVDLSMGTPKPQKSVAVRRGGARVEKAALGSAELPCSAPPDLVSLPFYWLVFHAVYPAVRISSVMLSVGA